ncbi:7TM diverse intracellular signaling domain-containing protein [Flavobacterium sp. SUN052]|uniref:hybrid sensor histidine kinase/response regulator n=1 Tax=Flavobacterium sp. SUN052 TaxID=3002441 RepID=UPI00237EDA89|nr:hybrid sensor histidine kinase/response regulator [Flavobacterium sp. SUN052]MEC4005001.1 7TM diverse intracellular signaling domain-containing protein [Flavobacterium sp. SUN052]
MKINKIIFVYLLVLFFFCISKSYSQFLIRDNQDFTFSSLHKNAKILDVDDQQLTINQVLKISDDKFKTLPNDNTDLGFTTSNYWLHFKIKNETNDDLQYYIETSRPIVDVAEFYQIKSNGVIEKQVSGDIIPFHKRCFQQRKTIFKLNIHPLETGNYYIHLKSDGEVINAAVILRSPENLVSITSFEQIIFGFFYGIVLIASILYIFFFYAMKERVFLYYSLYVIFIGLLQFSIDGYFHQLVTPNGGWFSQHSVLIFAMIAGSLLGKYGEVFLKIKQYNSVIYILFNVVYALAIVVIVIIFFVPSLFAYCYPLANILGLIILILIISSVIYLYYDKKPVDVFFSIGVVFLILGFGIFILNNFGKVPNNFITQNSSKLGTGLEIIFLSLSMGNLIKKLKEDRESLQTLALEKSEEMNEMKSYFLSNISHELRTPLNTIMNFIDSINGETDSKTIQEKCEVIKSSSNSLLSSVNDILDFSKIEKDEIKLEVFEFNAHKLFNEVYSNILIRAQNKGLDFQYVQSPNLPKFLIGDENRIRQILMNLLYNSLKFTNEGIVKFKVDCEIVDDLVKMTFIISDSGEGIAKEKMNSIFDSFSQQSINNKRKYGGLGLGLYIVKALVNLHGGKINIESILNQGTICTINLDLKKVDEKLIAKILEPSDYDLKGKRILVVEDNAMNQIVLKMIIKKWLNTEVDFANNGEEGLESLKNSKYDIILMDLQMPIMDGYEATIEIRKGNSGINDKNIPIIAVTADVMESTKIKVIELGMNHYMSKPIEKTELFNAILNLV